MVTTGLFHSLSGTGPSPSPPLPSAAPTPKAAVKALFPTAMKVKMLVEDGDGSRLTGQCHVLFPSVLAAAPTVPPGTAVQRGGFQIRGKGEWLFCEMQTKL